MTTDPKHDPLDDTEGDRLWWLGVAYEEFGGFLYGSESALERHEVGRDPVTGLEWGSDESDFD